MLLYWVYVIYRQDGTGVPCNPLSDVGAPSCDLYCKVGSTSYLLVLSFILLCRLRPSSPMSLRVWGGVGDSLGLGITRHAYLNRLSPTLYYHYGLWTTILCTGTLDPHMHRCGARTKVMAILLLTYLHVVE